LKGNKRKLAYW